MPSTISLPSLGGKRRVHNDGLLMLDGNYSLKETEQKYTVMKNRLKRLQDEDARAQRNQRAAELKAHQMMEARQRHYHDLLQKIENINKKNADEQAQRIKNNLAQKNRRDNIVLQRENWILENHNKKHFKTIQDE